MKNAIQSLRDNLQHAFSALAHEHAGEMLGRSSKAQILAGSVPRRTPSTHAGPTPAQPSRVRVALALEAQTDAAVLRSALDTAVRLDAELDVFTSLSAAQVRDEIAQAMGFAAERCNVIQLGPDLVAGITAHTRRHPDATFFFMNLQAPLLRQRNSVRPAWRALNGLFARLLPLFDRAQSAAAKTYS